MAEEKKFSGSNRPARKQAVPERKELPASQRRHAAKLADGTTPAQGGSRPSRPARPNNNNQNRPNNGGQSQIAIIRIARAHHGGQNRSNNGERNNRLDHALHLLKGVNDSRRKLVSEAT